ncbi:MAG: T9SS type A sorting domain-containing protein [Paludibacteraceae bacterium]|nr:T9SS type A sorting domain-containing protein [Paludibacteraceae bacterium]
MKNCCNLKTLVAVGLLALATGTAWGQCVDMSTLDDKTCGNVEAGVTGYRLVGTNTPQDTVYEMGWKQAKRATAPYTRQTLMDAEGYDNLCAELSVLPPNESTSFRLMNDGYLPTDTAKGEIIQIPLTVDAANPIILINYAAVMEVAEHPGIYNVNQTNCGFYVFDLDQGGKGYYSELYHYSAEKSSIQNWKSFNNPDRNNVLTVWKDWSKVGVDLSDWIGKTVVITLVNFDCALGGFLKVNGNDQAIICEDHHESHMYAHIACAPKELVFSKDCEGKEDSIFITAPEGFSYRWYKKGDKENTLSTERELQMPAADEDATYVCELTNHVGTFELEQDVDAAEIIVDDPVEVGFGETFTWPRSGEKIKITGDYEYIEYYTGAELQNYSKSCAKKIYRIHVDAASLDCPGEFSIKDTICGDAQGFNVAFHYKQKVDNTGETPITLDPSVKEVRVDFSDNWNNQENATVKIDENTTIVKKGYEDITAAIKVNGVAMDSVFRIPMPLDSAVTANGEKVYAYPRPDDYTMTLSVLNSCGQEETHTLSFTVFYPSWVIYQRWNDILSIYNETYNGGYEISNVRWYRNGQEIVGRGEHHSYIYTGKDVKLDVNDSYYAELTRSEDNKTFCTCRFRPSNIDKVENPIFKEDIKLVPSRSDRRQIEVVTAMSGMYAIYDLTGRVVQNGSFGDEYGVQDIRIDESVTRGTYLIMFLSNEGMQTTKKWIVE